MRIVSLIASSTEILCELGLKDQIVGRSHECDYPIDIKKVIQCTSPKFKTDLSSYAIDEAVKKSVELGLSVYKVDSKILEKLAPTHIFTQDQCEVCAVSLRDVEAAVCETIHSNPKIVSLKTDCIADLYRDILRVGESCNVTERAEKLIEKIKNGFSEIKTRSEAAVKKNGRPRVACIEWIDPLMTAGNWMPEIIEIAGGVSVFGEVGKHSPWLTWEELEKANPDVLFVSPCGFDIERTKQDVPILEKNPKWKNLKAVRENRVFLADGNQYFHRPGPRLLDSAQIMAEILQPDVFSPLKTGHYPKNWININSA